ncbi:MAG: GNAT family N-acetyltransferase [Candidatus Heimdallarchaeota archaeon]|nr:GNAT family N-acetyltransferase [Candidatus Heimdallarchaeota archaeon]
MTKKAWGYITVYDPSMAEKAAEMFNAFNELWPGGFGGGTPYTDQRVHDWLDQTSALADLIAIDDDGELVGYCGVYPHWRDPKAAYVSVLGVIPKVKGKKYGKRLLLKALEVCKEKGIFRMDLHTWSGNLEAVPLYKKVGLFWVPETTVYMQDFLPGLMQIPFAQEWFAKHPDWYNCFQRELEQEEDKEIIDGMEIYQYIFEEGGDKLVAEVDRYGWGFCGFHRILDDEELSIKTRVKSHDILMGVPNELTIFIENGTDKDLTIGIIIDSLKGLTWSKPFPQSILVKKGESIEINREFVVDNTAETFKGNERSSAVINSRLSVDNYNFLLITSGKIQPAVKIRSLEDFERIPIGKESVISLDLINNSKMTISGHVDSFIQGIENSQQNHSFKLKPEEISAIQIPITIPIDAGSNQFIINTTPIIELEQQEAIMPAFYYSVLAEVKGLTELIEIKEQNEVYLIADMLGIKAALEGGTINFTKGEGNGGMPIRHQTGPPYGLSLDRTLMYDYRLIKQDKSSILVLSAESRQMPGLQIEKHIKISPGQTEFEYWVTYTNLDPSSALFVGARTSVGHRGISLNPFTSFESSYIPINGKIIQGNSFTNFLTDPLIPNDPTIWSETWTAAEGILKNEIFGWSWNPKNISKIKVQNGMLSLLESETMEIKQGQSYRPVHLWFLFDMNSLVSFRKRWNQLIGNKTISYLDQLKGPEITKALEMEFEKDNILLLGQENIKKVIITFVSPYPLPGKLTLKLPQDWQGAFLTKEGKQDSIPMPEPAPFSNKRIELEIIPPKNTNSLVEGISVHFCGEFELDFELPVLLVNPKQKVLIKKKELANEDILEVSNGRLKFCISSDIGGNLIRLEDDKQRSFLLDSFPEVKPRIFFANHLGGLQPMIFSLKQNNPFNELESVECESVTEGSWKGVQCSWTIQKEKEYLLGQKFKMTYLTLPGSNIIKIKIAHENSTKRTIAFVGSLLADIALQGTLEKNVIEFPSTGQIWTRNPHQKAFISPLLMDNSWARVYRDDQSIVFVVPEKSSGGVVVLNLGPMIAGWVLAFAQTKPNETSMLEFAIIINQSKEKISTIQKAFT